MLNWFKKYFFLTHKKTLGNKEYKPGNDIAAIEVNDSHQTGPEQSGDICFKSGDLVAAAQHFKLAISAEPGRAILFNKLGDVFYEQQDFTRAEVQYRLALELDAGYLEAKMNLGLALDALGRFQDACSCYEQLIQAQPENYFAYFNLGVTLTSLGHVNDAKTAYFKVLEIKPGFSHAHYNLAILFQQQGMGAEAEAHYLKTLSGDSGNFTACCNLGNLYLQNGQLELARERFLQSLSIHPQHVESLHSLGLIALRLHQGEVAQSYLKHALGLNPRFAEAMVSLGDAYKLQNLLSEAEATYRQAIAIEPGLAGAYCNLGVTLHESRRYGEAIAIYQQGIANDIHSVMLYNNLGNTFSMINRFSDAEASYAKALQLGDGTTETYSNLAGLFAVQGKLEDAEKSYRSAVNLDAGYSQAYSNLLFMFNYDPDRNAEDIFTAYQEYERRYALHFKDCYLPFNNDKNRQRRLKIGYVSPDYCRHPVQYFFEPLISHHNKNLFEVYAYAQLSVEDKVTERYKTYADHWIETTGLNDEKLAERIRSDGIDILIDLAGHTANNRLPVLARKPAPVQVSWLGYGYTTGLTAIDYYFSDYVSAPPGSEHLFAEQVWRLNTPVNVYRPAEGMGEVSALPALTSGNIRIGTLTRSIRINYKTIRAWAAILKRVSNAVLVVDSANYQDAELRQTLINKFAAHGIEPSQLDIGFHSPPWDTLRSLDIGLDCFPHNSGTTLFETLYMGVPYVTLAGRPSVGRLGSSILTGVGHPEWIANTEEEYVDKVVALAEDIPRLAEIRSGLRQQMQNSVLMDEAGFTDEVERAYRAMWEKWCDAEQ